MENIYKIKIKSNLPHDVYPSERRYSSNIVLGLSVMFLALAATSLLMGSLVVKRLSTANTLNVTTPQNITKNPTLDTENTTVIEDTRRLLDKVEKDLFLNMAHSPTTHHFNMAAITTAAAFILSMGAVMAGFTGLLAWKRWYIDNNITWFFLSSCFSSMTSSISLLLIALTLMDARGVMFYKNFDPEGELPTTRGVSLGLASNIFITSVIGVIWSAVATNVAFKGMKNDYPDDIVLSKTGKKVTCTMKKGNRIGKVVAPDILSNFPKNGKLAKFFARRKFESRSGADLPKAESYGEYEERVKKFLSGGLTGAVE